MVSKTFISRHDEVNFSKILFTILLPVIMVCSSSAFQSVFGTEPGMEKAYQLEKSTYGIDSSFVKINEVYPDPSMDINEDGSVDQLDEFIELFNTGTASVNLSGWTISDATTRYTFDDVMINGKEHLLVARNLSNIKLGISDTISLECQNGTLSDIFEFQGNTKGTSHQRLPDGANRWSRTTRPTPGHDNPSPPRMVINEIMVDPWGANTGNQWVEIYNTGNGWSLSDFKMTDHGSTSVELPDIFVEERGRVVVFLGPGENLPPHPEDVDVIILDTGRSLYTNGDDLELIDHDGYTLDYIAWGNSSHVDRPVGMGDEASWGGKFYDPLNGTMTSYGSENPETVEGRSLMRYVDGKDEDLPKDMVNGPVSTGGTPGWNNSMDIGISLSFIQEVISVNTSISFPVEMRINLTGNMQGQIRVNATSSDPNWTIHGKDLLLNFTDLERSSNFNIDVLSPADPGISYMTDIHVQAYWIEMDFIVFGKTMEISIPSMDCSIETEGPELDGYPSSTFPEGSFISISGEVVCQGDVDGGDSSLEMSLRKIENGESGQEIHKEIIEMNDLKATSVRKFDLTIDTMGMAGNLTLELMIDPEQMIVERDESNNYLYFPLEIFPTAPSAEEGSIIFTDILWNCSSQERSFRFLNPTDLTVDISGFRISDGIGHMEFPDDSIVEPNTSFLVCGKNLRDDIGYGDPLLFSTDGSGPARSRMIPGEKTLQFPSSGYVELTTRYRDTIERIVLKRDHLDAELDTLSIQNFPETTYGSIMKRRIDPGGKPVDTGTHLDWKVKGTSVRLSSIMIDPGPKGPGEFITLECCPGEDLGGIVLTRGKGLISLKGDIGPGQQGRCIISSQPDDYRSLQNEAPQMEMSSCRVPGYMSLSLPNDGGVLQLLDRGNRLIERISWGSHDNEIDPGRGDVLMRYSTGTGEDRWMVAGTGHRPIISKAMNNISSSIMFDLKDIGLDADSHDRLNIVVSGFFEPDLFGVLLNARDEGLPMDIYLIDPVWARDRVFQTNIPGDVEAGWVKALSGAGARIFALEDPLAKVTSSIMFNSTCLWSFEQRSFTEGPLSSGPGNIIRTRFHGESQRETSDILRSSLNDREWYDASVVLDGLEVDLPRSSIEPENMVENCDETIIEEAGLFFATLPIRDHEYGGSIEYIHTNGPLDAVYLSHLLGNGCIIDLVIDPELMDVHGSGSKERIEHHYNRISKGVHLTNSEDLCRDIGERVHSLLMLSMEKGWKLNVGMMGDDDLFRKMPNIWIWSDHVSIQVIEGIDRETICWLDMISSDTGLCELFKDLSIRELPRNLFPGGMCLNEEGGKQDIKIESVYFDTYLKDDPDEAVRIYNRGSEPMDLSGYILTDDEGGGLISDGLVIFPEELILLPFSSIWIARCEEEFSTQFGFAPGLSILPGDNCTRVVRMIGDMRLSNSNDSLTLRDSAGTVIDAVVWGNDNWSNQWDHYEDGKWTKAGVEPPGWGRILKRRANWSSHILEDMNGIEDWEGFRPFHPGQSEIQRTDFVENTTVRGGICPENGIEMMEDIIRRSRDSISLNVYELTSDGITSLLIGARERGVMIRVLLEGGPVGGRSFLSDVQADRLTMKGIDVRWMANDFENDIRDRYRYDHAKYIVSDGKEVLVSTDNFKDSSFPEIANRGYGTRGWMVSCRSDRLASMMLGVFDTDWNGPDMEDNRVDEELVDLYYPMQETRERRASMELNGLSDEFENSRVMPLLCPDHLGLPDNPLIRSIEEAKDSIFLELMDITNSFSLHGKTISEREIYQWGYSPIGDIRNPYMLALMEAAKRGVRVRLLVDGSDFDGNGEIDSMPMVRKIRNYAKDYGINGSFQIKALKTPAQDLDGELGLIHVKGALFDGRTVWISSFNWNPTSAMENREVGLLVESTELCAYFTTAFYHDWGLTLIDEVNIDVLEFYRTKNGDSSVLHYAISVEWSGDEELSVELLDPESMETLHDAGTVPPQSGCILQGTVKESGENLPREIIVRIRSHERKMLIEELRTADEQENENKANTELLGSDWVPILLILILAMAISLSRTVISDIRKRGKRRISGGSEE